MQQEPVAADLARTTPRTRPHHRPVTIPPRPGQHLQLGRNRRGRHRTRDEAAWVDAGRTYERFALQATALDIRTAFVNQPIEVPALRRRFSELLGLDGEHAQLAVRFGHADAAPYSLRRPIADVFDT